MKQFKEYLLNNRNERSIRIVFDIETLQYNEEQGRQKPTLYKNVTYSFAIGYFNDFDVEVVIFPTSKDFFDLIIDTYKKWKTTPIIEIIAQNNNKYDNHFIRHDLKNFYDINIKNIYLKNATKEGNVLSVKKTKLTTLEKKSTLLEKRIKSSNNLELVFYLDGIQFHTVDNYVKTNASIKTLGKKLLNIGAIKEEHLKTDYNYTKYNRDYDMTEIEAYAYARKVYDQLSDDELVYIRNDIIILGKSILHYGEIFQGFDYSKITFTSNILEFYNDNDLTSYQLLKSVGRGKEKRHLKYTDYVFHNENFYDYLKSFYAGGLNFYNDKLVGQILYNPIFGMDINSSYPFVMHNYKVPTFLKDYEEFKQDTLINVHQFSDDTFYLYRMSKEYFDFEIIDRIESRILRQILVKYYSKVGDFVNINSYTLRMIKNITNIDIQQIHVLSYVSFSCQYFASRDKISEKYYVKTQGSHDKKIDYTSPYDIKTTNIPNEETFSQGEIESSKVILNGLYGIPALRSHFNLFRWVTDELQNIPNGYENNERNIVFSIFVTAVSLYNLLSPLKNLTQEEIDANLIYCDTDSLYLYKDIQYKIPSSIFHDYHLGKWSLEYDYIKKFIVVNHKKYAYHVYDHKREMMVTKVKSGGIPNDSFDLHHPILPFELFVEKYFSNGVKIKNTKSIYNKQGTISIYESNTELQAGDGYSVFAYDESKDRLLNEMIDEIKNTGDGSTPDLMYIESNLGTLSLSEIFPMKHDINKKSLYFLKLDENDIYSKHLQ